MRNRLLLRCFTALGGNSWSERLGTWGWVSQGEEEKEPRDRDRTGMGLIFLQLHSLVNYLTYLLQVPALQPLVVTTPSNIGPFRG